MIKWEHITDTQLLYGAVIFLAITILVSVSYGCLKYYLFGRNKKKLTTCPHCGTEHGYILYKEKRTTGAWGNKPNKSNTLESDEARCLYCNKTTPIRKAMGICKLS